MNTINVEIAKFMKSRILRVFQSKAALAKLRRGIGKNLGDCPDIFAFVLPQEEIAKYSKEEKAVEKAIYTAMTLYALHQQGCSQCMSEDVDSKGTASFGKAVKSIVNSDNEIAITRRFTKVLTSKDVTELAIHVRGLIGLLKQKNVPIDYPAFAIDLYWFQHDEYRRNVILKWGKDYYSYVRKEA